MAHAPTPDPIFTAEVLDRIGGAYLALDELAVESRLAGFVLTDDTLMPHSDDENRVRLSAAWRQAAGPAFIDGAELDEEQWQRVRGAMISLMSRLGELTYLPESRADANLPMTADRGIRAVHVGLAEVRSNARLQDFGRELGLPEGNLEHMKPGPWATTHPHYVGAVQRILEEYVPDSDLSEAVLERTYNLDPADKLEAMAELAGERAGLDQIFTVAQWRRIREELAEQLSGDLADLARWDNHVAIVAFESGRAAGRRAAEHLDDTCQTIAVDGRLAARIVGRFCKAAEDVGLNEISVAIDLREPEPPDNVRDRLIDGRRQLAAAKWRYAMDMTALDARRFDHQIQRADRTRDGAAEQVDKIRSTEPQTRGDLERRSIQLRHYLRRVEAAEYLGSTELPDTRDARAIQLRRTERAGREIVEAEGSDVPAADQIDAVALQQQGEIRVQQARSLGEQRIDYSDLPALGGNSAWSMLDRPVEVPTRAPAAGSEPVARRAIDVLDGQARPGQTRPDHAQSWLAAAQAEPDVGPRRGRAGRDPFRDRDE